MRFLKALTTIAVVGVTLASAAAAGLDADGQRVAITSNLVPKRTFVLTPLAAGSLGPDSGKVSVVSGPSRTVMRDGQKVEIYSGGVYTFAGKKGTLTVRERTEWVDVSNENTIYGYPPAVATGTWTVVRGTGQYAKVKGGGRSGHAGFGRPWLARHEGLVTTP